MSAQVETWRVSTVEGVFETDLETLKQWIDEGCVLPTDKVSKGRLNWIEAGRAPMLRAAFAGEADLSRAANTTSTSGISSSVSTEHSLHDESVQPQVMPLESADAKPAQVCHNHPQVASKHVCRACATAFCDECPRYYGTSKIALCPLCGDLCSLVEKIRAWVAHRELQSSGFGFADLAAPFATPFNTRWPCFLVQVSMGSCCWLVSADACLPR